jgi:hypothetical protein
MMKNQSTQIKWLEKEITKDQVELDKEKKDFINEIKKLKKEDILPKKTKKITLWQRIKKVLMG